MKVKLTHKQAKMLEHYPPMGPIKQPEEPKLSDVELFYDDDHGYFLGRSEWDEDLQQWFPYSKNSNRWFSTPAEACEAYKNKEYHQKVNESLVKSKVSKDNQYSFGNPCEYADKIKTKNESMKSKKVIKLKKSQISRLLETIAPEARVKREFQSQINASGMKDKSDIKIEGENLLGHPVAGSGKKSEYTPQSVQANIETTKSFNKEAVEKPTAPAVISKPYEVFVGGESRGATDSTGKLVSAIQKMEKNGISPHDIVVKVNYEKANPRVYTADAFLNWYEKYKHLNLEVHLMDETTIDEHFSIIGTLLEFGQEVINFLNTIFSDPSSSGLSPFWQKLGITRGELLSLLADFGIIATVGYKTMLKKNLTKELLGRGIKRLYGYLKDSKSPEQPEQPQVKNTYKSDNPQMVDELIYTPDRPSTPPDEPEAVRTAGDVPTNLQAIYVGDEIAILKDKNNDLYFFYYDGIDKKDYAEYAERTQTYVGKDEEGNPDYEYGDFEIDATAIEHYVNDNLNELSKGEGMQAYESGVDLVKIDEELKQGLMKTFGSERLNHLLNLYVKGDVKEETTAASSGSFEAPMGAPIKRPIAMMEGKVKKDGTPAQVKKIELEYRKADNKNMNCGNCTHYHEDSGQCDKIWGKVSIENICNAYKGKDVEEQTTTGSVGGQYVTNKVWAKSKKDMKFGKKPVWDGGQIVEESDASEGGFVSFDKCTKLNNNKEAQKGGCSQGAADKVVKITKTAK